MKRCFPTAFLLSLLFSCQTAHEEADLKLYFDRPAEYFEEAFVQGNGRTGITVFGGVSEEKIYLNEATFWAGEPVNPDMNPQAHTVLPEIRQALEKGDYELADRLQRKMQGSFSQSFAPLGSLNMNFLHTGMAGNYQRELDLSRAVSKVSYEVNGVTYSRECFVSHPAGVMVMRFKAGKGGSLDMSVGFDSQMKYSLSSHNGCLEAEGYAPWHAEPNYRGDLPEALRFDPARGTRFSALLSMDYDQGTLSTTRDQLILKDAREALLIVSLATSFNGFDKNPATEGRDHKALAEAQLAKADTQDYEQLLQEHLADYQHYFHRVKLDLGKSAQHNLPLDQRLKQYAEGTHDADLEELYFQYGRYLLISSSRSPEAPANLQGIWNPHLRPPWSSNYTMNINVEENYWPAEVTHLSEMHEPLLNFIGNLARTGKITARNFYGAGGWAAAHNSDIWAMSNPVGDFGDGHPVWANWNMSGAWLATHLWEHYLFTLDTAFLRKTAWPLMKGASRFCMDWLTEGPDGKLITSPSTSPENMYITPEGYRGATLYGATADLAMIRECLLNSIEACKLLNTDQALAGEMQRILDKLHPYHIGKKGNLQEWYYDWDDADPKHRHQSHLFGLYPGHHIRPDITPDLAEACRQSLEIKGDETTGWSMGWRINLWARLQDGDRAYALYRRLLRYVDPSGKDAKYTGGGTYPNLLDAHPPFQIDGNFGGTAGIAEMLLQSTIGEIHLLPALPGAWPEGYVSGLKARGGIEVSFRWKNYRVTEVQLTALENTHLSLICNDCVERIELVKNETHTLKPLKK